MIIRVLYPEKAKWKIKDKKEENLERSKKQKQVNQKNDEIQNMLMEGIEKSLGAHVGTLPFPTKTRILLLSIAFFCVNRLFS